MSQVSGPSVVRRMFAGGNTVHGFFSLYDNIIAGHARRMFILKGGPGAGKSTFMKKIAEDVAARGLACELFHCSADPDSLDAVAFPEAGIALVDGTAPHVIDPQFPGLVDEIVDLGRFCNGAALQTRREPILRWSAEGKRHYQQAYGYLAAAGRVRANAAAIEREALDETAVHRVARHIAEQLASLATPATVHGPVPASRPTPRGRQRRLFASSITPDGYRHHLDTLVGPLPHVFVVRGGPGTATEYVLEKAAATVAELGLDSELFVCALEPQRLEHVVVPALGAGVVTSRPPHDFEPPGAVCFDLNETVSSAARAEDAARARRLFGDLMRAALEELSAAKQCHVQVEELYAPAMDFDGIEALRLPTLARILDSIGND